MKPGICQQERFLSYKDYVKQHEVYHLNNCIQPFGDGPMSLNNISYDLFASMFSKANSYTYISTPYFIIDDNMIKVLVMAIKMGVDVRILIPGIPDKKTAYALTMAHLGEILEAGGKIYKYTPGFNHAKNIIIDDKYAFFVER
ncbi:MAG: phospholipase D-like domain-containing protein [Clostridium sp.]|nr:MAG: phospholipase D-like domain-containing protein [Clostridium sp.]